MPTSDQITALIKSHFDKSEERFATIALQIAAHEARIGHTNFANDIKGIIDKFKAQPLKLKPLNQDMLELVYEKESFFTLSDIVLPVKHKQRIERVLLEYFQRDKLERYGLTNRRKLLLTGPPGTGKTLTASIIARELHLPLYVVMIDKIVTKYMGETSMKLRLIFDLINDNKGVYLFDEFDAIGADRSNENDVGEIRRVLNSFLQFIELDSSESIIIAATNHAKLLDQALFRRFDDVLHYQYPTPTETIQLLKSCLAGFIGSYPLTEIAEQIHDLSHAEITLACQNAIKHAILFDHQYIEKEILIDCIQQRNS
jgi:SpoVK/Ycf46/Vps4 family AAA+-type ATPase